MVVCGRLLRPNSTPPPLPSSMPYFFIVPPFAHITSQGLCSYCSQKNSSCWDHKAMWLPLQEMSRIMRTGGKGYKSIKWCILMLTVVWTKVVLLQSVQGNSLADGCPKNMGALQRRSLHWLGVVWPITALPWVCLAWKWDEVCVEKQKCLWCVCHIFLVFALFYGWVVHSFCSGSTVVLGEPSIYLWAFQLWGFQQQWFMVVMGLFKPC